MCVFAENNYGKDLRCTSMTRLLHWPISYILQLLSGNCINFIFPQIILSKHPLSHSVNIPVYTVQWQ